MMTKTIAFLRRSWASLRFGLVPVLEWIWVGFFLVEGTIAVALRDWFAFSIACIGSSVALSGVFLRRDKELLSNQRTDELNQYFSEKIDLLDQIETGKNRLREMTSDRRRVEALYRDLSEAHNELMNTRTEEVVGEVIARALGEKPPTEFVLPDVPKAPEAPPGVEEIQKPHSPF